MKNRLKATILSALIAMIMSPEANSQYHFSGPRNAGPTLNTPNNDTGSAISPNGLSLYFTSTGNNFPGGQGGNDIWVSQRATLGTPWGPPQNLTATINTSSNDNMGSFSLDGRTMFFQSNRPGLGLNDIYMATRTDPNDDFGWAAPIMLPAPVNSTFGDLNAAYFEHPVTGAASLIFSSDRFDGVNAIFYQSTRNGDGTFNAPTAIDELNGPGFHFGAAIRRDGLEIFIGSTRPGGLNLPGFDIWVSTRSSTSAPWGTPVLVPGINSLQEDRVPKLSPDGSILYFQSDRPGGQGGLDLYSANRCSLYLALASPCSVNILRSSSGENVR
jgi:hypothetical protein